MAYYASQCFPARNLLRFKQNSDGGAWLLAYKEEQRRRFDAVLCPDAKTEQRKKTQNAKRFSATKDPFSSLRKDGQISLSGIYLLKQMNVEDPSDLAYITISGKNLSAGKYEDFVLFDNVVHIEAGENNLTLETFRTFPALRELELQLNNINNLSITSNDFKLLEFLDLSYNSLTANDILSLGTLESLKCLHLTGNGLKTLPAEMAHSYRPFEGQDETSDITKRRFQLLEVLYLDENLFEDISVFASLASLRSLRVLSLSKNSLLCVPHLRLLTSPPHKQHLIPHGSNLEESTFYETQDDPDSRQLTQTRVDEVEVAKDDTDEHFEVNAEQPNNASQTITANDESGHDLTIDFEQMNLADRDEFNLGTDLELGISNVQSDVKLENALAAGGSNFDSTDMDLSRDIPEYPFQNLERLDLSYNQIEEEQAVLPLAAWPSLIQVNIWENPLTKNCKGVPPLLNYHLTKLCGIALNRKEPKKLHKPAVGPAIAPAVRFNKVNDVMPPMRRKNMLMLEFENYEAALKNGSLYGQPLPPITPKKENQESKEVRDTHSAPARPKNKEDGFVSHETQRPHSVAADQFFEPHDTEKSPEHSQDVDAGQQGPVDKRLDGEGVFLTQVDDVDMPKNNLADDFEDNREEPSSEIPEPSKPSQNDLEKSKTTVKTYNDYEELLKIEGSIEDVDTPAADDLRGNLKALKHALNHPLVFNEPLVPDERRQDYTRQSQHRATKSSTQTKRDKVNTALENMRKQTNVVEESLDVVLERYDTDPEMRRKFPEVKTLLKQVQSKYNEVRLASLESAAAAQTILKGSNKSEKNISNGTRSFKHAKKGLPLAKELKREDDNQDNKEKRSESARPRKDPMLGSEDVSATLEKLKEQVGKRI